ncbi:MAG: alpha/beta hydrolase [Acidobacteria bacterium]|nr:MAG: alpha/beta hydrolase [Acidobacteriota bacterium]
MRLLCWAVGTVVLACLLASLIESSWGRVKVQGIKVPTQDGQWVVADLFKPATATKQTPAPLVVVVPGFQRSKEALENIAVELSRRGIVAVAIDPYAQGASSSSVSSRAATTEGYGMFAIVDYAARTGNLNYVDKSRIGATGHSAGGNAAVLGAAHFGKEAIKTGKPSALDAVFVSGYLLSFTDKVLRDVRSNVGMSYARYDEGAYRNELKNGDMRHAPEAIRLVDSGRGPDAAPVAEVELGRYYGDATRRTLRVVYNERVLHPFQPYSVEAIAHQIEFFERVFGTTSGLSSRDQVWYWRELLGLISLVAALVALVPLARILLRTPVFQPLAHPLPPPQPPPDRRARLVGLGLSALGALVACATYIPMTELSQRLFVAASSRVPTWFFPQRMNNPVLLWAVLNGLAGFLLVYLGYRLYGKRLGVRLEMWGVRVGAAELVRICALALVLFTSYYGLLFAVYYVLHVDYRFLFMGARVFQPEFIVLLGMYAPFFLVFFLSNAVRVNGAMRVADHAEWKSMLTAGIANSAGLLLIVAVQYVTFAVTGTVRWTEGWLYVNLLFAVVPMMFVLPYFNRYFFRLTGRPYLGAITTCLVFVMILLTNTVCYLPL